jgi:MFS family permease
VLVFQVYLGVLAVAGLALLVVSETVMTRERLVLRFVGLRIPTAARGQFLAASVAGFASLALLGLFTALAPSLLGGVLHVRNHAAGGALVFLLFAASTLTQIGFGQRAPHTAMRFGLGLFPIALALIVAALEWTSMTLFITCTVVGGIAAGAAFLGSLATANRLAPPEIRGQVVSAYFTVAYVGLTIPVIGVGFSAEHIGYLAAVSICAACLAVLCIGTLLRVGTGTSEARPPS